MGFLDRAIRNGISKGIGDAVGKAVRQAVEPTVNEYADRAAERIDRTARDAEYESREVRQSARQSVGGLNGAFADLQRSMESYATNAAKNMKICPQCQKTTGADKKFCPDCGARLPEQTLAQGSVCPNCGKQNAIGTRFCDECGTKLPSVVAEERAAADRSSAALAQWRDDLPQYPVWNGGGTELSIERYDGYYAFTACLESSYAARNAINRYRDLLMQHGFRQAGQYPTVEHLYKKINARCYHVDTEHCFEGDSDAPTIYFNIEEPSGGFDYVKPEPQRRTGGFRDLLKF